MLYLSLINDVLTLTLTFNRLIEYWNSTVNGERKNYLAFPVINILLKQILGIVPICAGYTQSYTKN